MARHKCFSTYKRRLLLRPYRATQHNGRRRRERYKRTLGTMKDDAPKRHFCVYMGDGGGWWQHLWLIHFYRRHIICIGWTFQVYAARHLGDLAQERENKQTRNRFVAGVSYWQEMSSIIYRLALSIRQAIRRVGVGGAAYIEDPARRFEIDSMHMILWRHAITLRAHAAWRDGKHIFM